ncbi:site-specific integrase [Rhizobium johnstonii]|uniref:site-specific integrase n=1 Tax=Rhizobium johnstonii TaxID=3019933 RepID=UPI002DDD4438|nr:site-specific integrase [Rhizobium johnstonii]
MTDGNQSTTEIQDLAESCNMLHQVSCNLLHNSEGRFAARPTAEVHLSSKLKQLLDGAVSESTKKAYQGDLKNFVSSGGSIPCSPEKVAEYAASCAEVHKPATVARRLISIGKAHRLSGFENPVTTDIVKLAMRGLKRSMGSAQREAKPVLREDLFRILDSMSDDRKSLRDRALLLLCFAGGFRRSEVVSLDVEDIQHVQHGIVIRLARSKTDQEGKGRKVAVPFGRGFWCPVRAIDVWISASAVQTGPLFRVINRHNQISEKRLSGQAVSLILKARANKAGFDGESYSGHSLRAGFVTSAAIAGATSLSIRKQTGHRSDGMLNRYIREANLFAQNATAAVL